MHQRWSAFLSDGAAGTIAHGWIDEKRGACRHPLLAVRLTPSREKGGARV